ncbi:unnamed protein product [Rhodiola kirilowii]
MATALDAPGYFDGDRAEASGLESGKEMSTFRIGFKTSSAPYLLHVLKINSSLSGCCFCKWNSASQIRFT